MAAEEVEDLDAEKLDLKQGLLLSESYRINGTVLSVAYQPSQHKFITLSDKEILLHQYKKETHSLHLESPLQNILYAEMYDEYVGVAKKHLQVLLNDLSVIFNIETSSDVTCSLYNPCTGDIITGGCGQLTIWSFHQGGKTLVPNQVIHSGLEVDDEVSLLHLELVPGKAQRCFVVIGTGVKVYHIDSGRLLHDVKGLHGRPISSLLFFRPLQCLITGSQDGTIKVWNSSWELQCCFIGHQAPVTSLTPHPTGPILVSASLDSSMRLWSLLQYDEVERLDHLVPVQGLLGEPGQLYMLSYSTRQVKVWHVNMLYRKTTIVGVDTTYLSCSKHPRRPPRLLAVCDNATVHIISANSGSILSTVLLPPSSTTASAVYQPNNERIYSLDTEGQFSIYDSSTHPSTLLHTGRNDEDHFTTLALYEVVYDEEEIEAILSKDKWLSVLTTEAYPALRHMDDPLKREKEGHYLLLAGSRKGYLHIVDRDNGNVLYSAKGHNKEISIICCNSKNDQVITSSPDLAIVIWRVYPYSCESLSVMMSFDVTCSPAYLSILEDRLCAAVNNIERACYSLTIYSLCDATMFSSDSAYNHTELVTGLDVCERLHIFVSCGRDYTIRVWSEDNNILRILHLDGPPTSLVFSTHVGAITMGLHHHLHTITHPTYLTDVYMKQLVAMGITGEQAEEEGEAGRELEQPLECYSEEDCKRLTHEDDQIQLGAYRGSLSMEELDALDKAALEKSKAIQLLVAREQDMRMIRDATLPLTKPASSKPLTKAERNEVWQRVYEQLHPLPSIKIQVSPHDDFDPDTYGLIPEIPEPYEPYNPGPQTNFFPPLATFEPPYPIAPDGYLPNSVVLMQMRKSEEDKKLALGWKPPVLSLKQRQLMDEMAVEEVEEEEEESDLMSRFKDAMAEPIDSHVTTPSPTPPPSPPPPPKKEIRSVMKVEKLVAPKRVVKPPTPPPRSPTPPPRSPTPPPTPLPEYIAQFMGQHWFDTLYPNASSKTFPKPWSVTRFIYSLLSHYSSSKDPSIKAEILTAIHKLIRQYTLFINEDIIPVVITNLKGPPTLTTSDPAQKYLITRSLDLLFHMDHLDNQLVSLMMGFYSEGDAQVQESIMSYLTKKGVDDSYGYFSREMTSTISGSQLSEALVKSMDWLDYWATDYFKGSKKGSGSTQSTPARSVSSQSSVTRSGRGSSSGKKAGKKIPQYNAVDVINHFIKVERERELARAKPATPPPAVVEVEELRHNVVVPLPPLDHHSRCLVRLGDTHCSRCHPHRETTLHLVRSVGVSQTWHALRLAVNKQTLNPFLTEDEQCDIISNTQDSLISNNKLFLLEQSYPK